MISLTSLISRISYNKFKIVVFLLLVICLCVSIYCNDTKSFFSSKILNIVHRNDIDEAPVWSKNGEEVAVKTPEGWLAVKIRSHSDRLTHSDFNFPIRCLSDELFLSDFVIQDENPRKIMIPETNCSLESLEFKMGTRLVFRSEDMVEILYETDLDVLHSFSVSPDNRWCVFLSETNGLMLIDVKFLKKLCQKSKITPVIDNPN